MAEYPDQATQAYILTLPLVLAPFAAFSSSSSSRLFSIPQPSTSRWTKCVACSAELVSGVSGSRWVERGALWAKCSGCGWSSRRRGKEATGEAGGAAEATAKGKELYGPVRKRRRVRQVPREALHPTAMRAETGAAMKAKEVERGLPAPPAKKEKATAQPTAKTIAPSPAAIVKTDFSSSLPSRPPSSASSSRATTVAPPLPSSETLSRPTRSTLAAPKPFSMSASPAPSPKPVPSSQPSLPPEPSKTPAPSSSSTPAPPTDSAASKKRKRGKHSGLAELLEAKKKKEQEAKAGGTGLMDFLQGL
ncbi:hypothetical protein JCM8547_007629 [Rhodosporidiobolus lusitaniae]